MKNMTHRVLIASLLMTPTMLFAKPAPKKKKPTKPVVEEKAQAPEELDEAEPAPPPAKEVVASNYGMAGCGLGSYVIKDNSIMQIFAATTNGTSYSQLFGLTSGTSNCNETGANYAMEQRVFVEANLVSLKREAASGQGETLTAFADLLGCDVKDFASVSQANYGEIYKANEATDILQGYKAVLNTQCSRLI